MYINDYVSDYVTQFLTKIRKRLINVNVEVYS